MLDLRDLGLRRAELFREPLLGRLSRHTGGDHGQEHLTTARTMYRAMVMRFWLEKAEAPS